MNLPFTTEQFFNLFADYNRAVWPVQLLAYVLGAVAVWCAFNANALQNRLVPTVLAAFWIWTGVVYHLNYFSAITQAAYLFGVLFVVEGLLFIWFRKSLRWQVHHNARGILGALFIIYAMVIYPLLGVAFGHLWPKSPMFGIAPCPTTIYTFGFLVWLPNKAPWQLLVIPLLWSFVGISAALQIGVKEDWGLLIAGLLGTAFILLENRRTPNNLVRGGINS